MAPAYKSYVEKAYRAHLVNAGAADDLADAGEVGAALELPGRPAMNCRTPAVQIPPII